MTRRDVLFTTGAYGLTRGLLVVVAWLALTQLPLELTPRQWQAFPNHLWLDGWARWDSGWYQSVFLDGYSYEPGRQSNVNFFPLYPWTAGLLSLPLRPFLTPEGGFYLAAIVLSHLGSWLAMLGLHAFARGRLGRPVADRAVWLLCLYPWSFYLGAAYTEGPFLALAVWSFRLADRERWLTACGLAAAAAVTRVPGFSVAIGLAILYVERHGLRPARWGREVLAFALTPLPLLALLGFFALRFGDPLVFVTTQRESWGHTPGIAWGFFWHRLTSDTVSWPGRIITFWRFALLPTVPVAVALAWRRLGPACGVYVLLVLGLPLLSTIQALERYYLPVFPVFVALAAALHRPAALRATLAGFAPWLAWFTACFARWASMVGPAR